MSKRICVEDDDEEFIFLDIKISKKSKIENQLEKDDETPRSRTICRLTVREDDDPLRWRCEWSPVVGDVGWFLAQRSLVASSSLSDGCWTVLYAQPCLLSMKWCFFTLCSTHCWRHVTLSVFIRIIFQCIVDQDWFPSRISRIEIGFQI